MSIVFEEKNSILYIEIQNEKHGNAFKADYTKEIVEKLNNEKIKGVLFLTKGQRFFCTGGNLSDYARQETKSEGLKTNNQIKKCLEVIYHYKNPTVCLVNGDCFGGGVELVSCFDFVISSPHSFFGLWQRKLNLSFGWGGYERLKSRMSLNDIKSLFATARSLSSYEALDIGVIDQICQEEQLLRVGVEWIESQFNLPKEPLQKIKKSKFFPEESTFKKLWFNDFHRGLLESFKDKKT